MQHNMDTPDNLPEGTHPQCDREHTLAEAPGKREVACLMAWLRKNPDIGSFDEAAVAARYAELCAQHEREKAAGKPGWMRMPANLLRDELIRATREAALAALYNPAYVLHQAQVVVEGPAAPQIFTIQPAPVAEFVDALATQVWRCTQDIPRVAIRELCANFAHAFFEGVRVTISHDGHRVCFEDCSPGADLSRIAGPGFRTVHSALAAAPKHISLLCANRASGGFCVRLIVADGKDQPLIGAE